MAVAIVYFQITLIFAAGEIPRPAPFELPQVGN